MLNKHSRASRGQLLAGGGAVCGLLLGSLVLTASGTQAATRMRTSVEDATGVDLANMSLPDVAQIDAPLPPTPPLPPASPLPATPPVPPAPPLPPSAHGKHVRVIVRDKDGKVTETTSRADAPVHAAVQHERRADVAPFGRPVPPVPPMPPEALSALRNMPQVLSRNCGPGGAGDERHFTLHSQEGGKSVTVICSDRIASATVAARASADVAQRHAMVVTRHANINALRSLHAARGAIEGNQSMTNAQRAAALSGIDEAIRDMESKAER